MLNGLILAATSSTEDDLAYRLQGRSRYALPLANRVLVRYAAESLVAVGVEDVAVAISSTTAADVTDLLGDGSRFGARFRYLEVGENAPPLEALGLTREAFGDRPVIVHAGDALLTAGLREVVAEFERERPQVLLVSKHSEVYPEPARSGVRGTESLASRPARVGWLGPPRREPGWDRGRPGRGRGGGVRTRARWLLVLRA